MDKMVEKEMNMGLNSSFWKSKKVFITGHTGFKGSWLTYLLLNMGAEVMGYALKPYSKSLFNILELDRQLQSSNMDIRDYESLAFSIRNYKPDIIFHMAAQSLVRDSYRAPRYTYEVNVMGTINLLDALRIIDRKVSVVNITTDKVYENKEWIWGYRENEPLNGYDPYSNSKSCSELVSESYKNSFFLNKDIRISTARAGNVIGGGDFGKDRIITDCVNAAIQKSEIVVRNPHSIRPYQHVLEALSAYLMIAEKQYYEKDLQGCYNVGPEHQDCITTSRIADMFCRKWGEGLSWRSQIEAGPHESHLLMLDSTKINRILGWKPTWDIEYAIDKTIEWTKTHLHNGNVSSVMDRQIEEFYSSIKNRV